MTTLDLLRGLRDELTRRYQQFMYTLDVQGPTLHVDAVDEHLPEDCDIGEPWPDDDDTTPYGTITIESGQLQVEDHDTSEFGTVYSFDLSNPELFPELDKIFKRWIAELESYD